MNVLVVGYYNHCNLGDEQYKWSIKHILTHLPNRIPQSVEFIDCDKLIDYTIPENCTILLGGGDVLNHYFLDKLNNKFINVEKRPKIIAFSVGIPYNSIFLQPENLKKLELFDHIYLRTRQDISVFSQFVDPNKVSYLPDASCFLPDAFNMKSPSSYFTPLTRSSPCPSPTTNDMYKKLYSALYSLHKTKKIINVNLCRHIYHPQYQTNYETIVRELARFLEELTKKGYYLVLLPFNVKPTPEGKTDDTNCENDILIHNDVLRNIKNHANILNIDYELSLGEILSLYPFFYMSLPMRFHGTLFSINAAVPMIPIYTTKKIKNALLDIGWTHEYVFDKNEKDLPISFNPKKMMMTFLDCVRHHTKGKIQLKSQFENFKHYYDAEKSMLETRIFSPFRVTKSLMLDIIPPPPPVEKPAPDQELYDTYFSSPLAPNKENITRFSENPLYFNNDNIITVLFNKLQLFTEEHNIADFREIKDPTLKNVAVCVVSYYLTGQIDSQYNHGLLEKMFSSNYRYEDEWKWVLQHHKTNGKVKPVLTENPEGPFNIGYIDQNDQSGAHRSGWSYVFKNLIHLNNSNAPVLLDLYIDRTFHWKRDIYKYIGIIPYRQSWVGFIHHTFNESFSEYNNYELLNCPEFLESLPYCRGIIVLSNYLKNQFEEELRIRNIDVPVFCMVHPTEIIVPKFNMLQFYDNSDKKLIQVGGWLRNIFSFYQLELTPHMFLKKNEMIDLPNKNCILNLRDILRRDRQSTQHRIRKVALKGKFMENYYPPADFYEKIMKAFQGGNGEGSKFCSSASNAIQNNWLKHMAEYMNRIEKRMDVLNAVDNKTYDALLTNNLVFLNLVDGSAVNTIIECVVRNTPVFVNRHPAAVEILGKNYPLYYDNPKDINQLLENPICIKNAHEYMRKIPNSIFDINNFIYSLQILTKNLSK